MTGRQPVPVVPLKPFEVLSFAVPIKQVREMADARIFPVTFCQQHVGGVGTPLGLRCFRDRNPFRCPGSRRLL